MLKCRIKIDTDIFPINGDINNAQDFSDKNSNQNVNKINILTMRRIFLKINLKSRVK